MKLERVGAAVRMILALVAAATVATGAQASDPARRVQRPDWAELPSGDDMAQYYPERAMREGVSGRATLTCEVTVEGSLTACTAVEDKPGGYGFDEAALALSALFRMKPATKDGQPVAGGAIVIPLVFQVPEGGGLMGPHGMKFGDGVITLTKLAPDAPQNASNAMVLPCPDGGGQCLAHMVVWTRRPDPAAAAAILKRSGQTSGLTLADCVITADGALRSCEIRDAPTPAAVSAAREALSLLRAAPLTQDGAPTAGARAQIPFQWDWLLAGVKSAP